MQRRVRAEVTDGHKAQPTTRDGTSIPIDRRKSTPQLASPRPRQHSAFHRLRLPLISGWGRVQAVVMKVDRQRADPGRVNWLAAPGVAADVN
jgi:hypothetical protein